MESNMNRTKPSRFKALVSAFALGSSLCFAHTSAWAVCTDDIVIDPSVTTTQLISNSIYPQGLCSFTVPNNRSISTTTASYSWGILNSLSTITSLINNGSISTTGSEAHGIANYGTITSLTNAGSISASSNNAYGISNGGVIGTLNNQQGASGSALTYAYTLPTNYNIIVGSSTNYGKLSVTSPTNASGTSGITFNIYGNSGTTLVSGVPASTLAAGTYSGVITGLSISNIITGSGFSVTGTFPGGYSWELIQTSIASGIWDLVVTENLPQNTLSAVATSNSISVTGTSTLSTNGGSGSGNVTYALVSGPCSLSGATLTGTGVGNCVVTATKAADSTYVSATSAQLTVAVSLATQTSLVLAASSDSITVNGTSTLSTSGGSGTGNVTYALDGPCTLSGATLTGTDVGNCVVTATKAADSTFASRSATLTVSITAAPSSPNTIGAGSSVSLGSLIVGSNPVLSGGTLVLNNGDSSSVPFEVTSIGGTIQAPPSGSAVLSGVFSGSGGLTFTGTGTGTTTILSGTNTYTGGTTVSGGTLSVAGSSPTGSGDVFVSSAGSLMGTGTISGNITVRGVLKPGNSPGYLSMLQNLTLNSGATFIEDIAGTTPSSSTTPVGATGYYAVLNVGGQLIIDSGTTLTPRLSNLFSPSEPGFGSPIYVPVLGNVFRMITTTGGISGRFTTLTQPAELSSGTQLLAFYNVNNSKSIDLAVVPTSYSTSLAGGTPSVMSAASVLDQWVLLNKAGTATAAQNQLLFGVASQSAANLSAYVQANAAEILATAAATAPIPTLSEWAMILLVSLMGMWVFVTQRMSKRKATLQARQR
jgi:hypothetical protein